MQSRETEKEVYVSICRLGSFYLRFAYIWILKRASVFVFTSREGVLKSFSVKIHFLDPLTVQVFMSGDYKPYSMQIHWYSHHHYSLGIIYVYTLVINMHSFFISAFKIPKMILCTCKKRHHHCSHVIIITLLISVYLMGKIF